MNILPNILYMVGSVCFFIGTAINLWEALK